MYVLLSLQNLFGVLPRLCQGNGKKIFYHSKFIRGQHNTVSRVTYGKT